MTPGGTKPADPRDGASALRRFAIGLLTRIPAVRGHVDRDRTRAHETAAIAQERDLLRATLTGLRGAEHAGTPVGSYLPYRDQPPLTDSERSVIDAFHDLYYTRWQLLDADTINVSWFGWKALKLPLDLWSYQEVIVRLRPEVIVETGTNLGGSAMFLATMFDLLGRGEVLTIDIDDSVADQRPVHPRILYLTGSSTAPRVVEQATRIVAGRSCIVILDSAHGRDHVLAELRAYSSLVPVGSYLIVEDTNINGHPTRPSFGPGPMEAVDAFLAEDDRFEVDPIMERFLLTMNPRGYLRRVR